ncbi:hypothetical protein Tco_0463218 [Tanacetum coccineum]
MMTYLKNMGGYKHYQLKAKSFEEIKGMYERQKKSVQDFVPIGSAKEEELIKKMNEKATGENTSNNEKVLEEPNSTKVEVKQEGHEDSTRKRPGRILKMKAAKKSKRQKTNSDLEEEEQLKAFLMIVPDEEGIIDYEVLEKRSDGSSKWIKTFSEMVTSVENLEPVLEPVVVEPKVVSQPKVWSDAPIIEKYESDSDDEYDDPQKALKNKGALLTWGGFQAHDWE